MILIFISSTNLSSEFQRHTHLTVYLMSALRCLRVAQSSVSKTEFLIILLKTYSSHSFLHFNERCHPFSYSAKDLGVISFPHTSYTKPLANPVTCTLEYRCTQQNVFLVNIFLIEFLLVFNTQLW